MFDQNHSCNNHWKLVIIIMRKNAQVSDQLILLAQSPFILLYHESISIFLTKIIYSKSPLIQIAVDLRLSKLKENENMILINFSSSFEKKVIHNLLPRLYLREDASKVGESGAMPQKLSVVQLLEWLESLFLSLPFHFECLNIQSTLIQEKLYHIILQKTVSIQKLQYIITNYLN